MMLIQGTQETEASAGGNWIFQAYLMHDKTQNGKTDCQAPSTTPREQVRTYIQYISCNVLYKEN